MVFNHGVEGQPHHAAVIHLARQVKADVVFIENLRLLAADKVHLGLRQGAACQEQG